MSSNLFAIVYEWLQEGTATAHECASDEATFVQQLRTSALRASEASDYVANVCAPVTPAADAVQLEEAHLPLVARVLGTPIGIVSATDGVPTHVPHQWLPVRTTADPSTSAGAFAFGTDGDDANDDDGDNDDLGLLDVFNDDDNDDALGLAQMDDALSVEEATVHLLHKDAATDSTRVVYSVVEEEARVASYASTYRALAQAHGWHIATDDAAVSVTLVPVSSLPKRPKPSLHSLATVAATTIAREWTASTSWDAVATSLNVLRNQLAQRQFVGVWGNTYAFPSDDARRGTGFPSVHEARFAERLYAQCPEMQQALLGSGATTCATFKAHQQVVRTFFSPLTPYRSLLLIHGTGTGKTFTALGLTAAFREYVTQQDKRIHIACPRQEVCDEFKSYLSLHAHGDYVASAPSAVSATGACPPQTPKAYTQAQLATDEQTVWHDEPRPRPKRALQDTYNIQTHRSLFDDRTTAYTLKLQQVYTAWRWLLPTLSYVQRTPSGFTLRAPLVGETTTTTDAEVIRHVQKGFDQLSTVCATRLLGERWTYVVRVAYHARQSRSRSSSSGSGSTTAHAKKTKHVVIDVRDTRSLHAYEAHIVATYSETVLVVDEAHYISDTPSGGGGANADDDGHSQTLSAAVPRTTTATSSQDTPRTSWRVILQLVIAVLRFHRTRMRLVLLTATPMTNSDADAYTLLNLMVHNDGFEHERPFLNAKGVLPTSAHLNRAGVGAQMRAWRNSVQFVRCVQGRVSYFRSDEGKPTQLAAEDLFYNVPTTVDTSKVRVVQGRACDVLVVADVNGYLRESNAACNTKDIPQCVWRTSSSSRVTSAVAAMHEHTTTVQHPNQQQYVYVVVERTTSEKAVATLLPHVHQTRTTCVFLCTDSARATAFANDTSSDSLAVRLFARASMRRPMRLFAHGSSAYHVPTQAPAVYAARTGNLPAFLSRYLPRTAAASATYAPTIVATPMRNDALYATTPPARTLRYKFRGRQLQTFNVDAAPTKRVYQPKLDTLFAMMETLPGNVFIYTDEVRLDDTGSQTLQRLKQCIEARFRKQPASRLSNVHVEILHKETLAKQLQQQQANRDHPSHSSQQADDETHAQLQQRALNERIAVLNRTLLRTRDDVVLLGAEEVKEGLTFNEIRQVHLLSPAWNQATMEQVIGRAVRIGNHQKRARHELHSVACVLHVSVPETPDDPKLLADEMGVSTTASVPAPPLLPTTTTSATNPLTRVVGDLHRYDFVTRKQTPIAQTMVKLRRYAWDVVLQDTSVHVRECVMSETDKRAPTCPWRLTKRHVMDERVSSVVQSLRRSLSSSSSRASSSSSRSSSHVTPLELPPTVHLPRETVRAEIDTLKHNVCEWFAHTDTPHCTFAELQRVVKPYYVAETTDAFAWVKQRGHVELPLVLRGAHAAGEDTAHPTGAAATLAYLHSLLLTQYLWRVAPHPTTPDTHLVLHVEPLSVLSHPDWLAAVPTSAARPPPQTLVELRRRVSAQPNGNTLGSVLDQLTTAYALPRQNQNQRQHHTAPRNTDASSPQLLHGVQLQLVTPDALAYALDELVRHNTLIDRRAAGNSHVLRLREGYYTLESVHVPVSAVYPPLRTTEATPYSVRLPTKRAMTAERVKQLLHTMHATATCLVACVKPFAVASAHRGLLGITYEHVFDRLSFVEQDALLEHFAKHGIAKSAANASQATLLQTAVRHRFIEKGARSSDVFPAEAADVLHACFAADAGRAYMRFSRTSAKEPCIPAWYVSPQKAGKQQAQLVTYVPAPTPSRAARQQTVSYFSPVPVVQHERTLLFASSARVVHASLGKLASQLPAFGYNEVYNWKDRHAGYLHDPKLCADTRLQDDLKKTNSLLHDTSRDILQELHDKRTLHPSTWTAPLAQVEQRVSEVLHGNDSNLSHIDPAHYVRYVLLRRANAYMRFFYPGIVTKHPETNEYYASYRHKDDDKRRL